MVDWGPVPEMLADDGLCLATGHQYLARSLLPDPEDPASSDMPWSSSDSNAIPVHTCASTPEDIVDFAGPKFTRTDAQLMLNILRLEFAHVLRRNGHACFPTISTSGRLLEIHTKPGT